MQEAPPKVFLFIVHKIIFIGGLHARRDVGYVFRLYFCEAKIRIIFLIYNSFCLHVYNKRNTFSSPV